MFLKEFSNQDKSIGQFSTAVNGLSRLLWRDEITGFEFIDEMVSVLNIQFRRAWAEGAATCGITPDEFTPQEISERERFINSQLQFLPGLADFILENNRESGALFGSLSSRTGIWINRYAEVVEVAKGIACKNRKLKWVIDPLIDNCSSCLRLNGKVKRASFWNEKGIIPRVAGASYLECRGFRCGCSFQETSEPLSRGRLPSLP